MRLGFVLAVLCACGGSWVGPPRFGNLEPVAHPFTFAPDVVQATLGNGLRVAVVPDARTNLVTVDVRYLVGAGDDPTGSDGLAHFAEHLLFETRATSGGPTLAGELGAVSLEYNAWTSLDELHFTTTTTAAQLDAVLALEARRMSTRCAEFDDDVIARERDVVLAEEDWRADSFDALRADLFTTLYGAGHRYTHAGRGGVAGLGRQAVCAFIAAHLRPASAVVVVGGAVDPAAVQASVARLFAAGAAAEPALQAPVPAVSFRGTTSRHRGPVRNPQVLIAFPHPAWGATGRHAADLAASLLADQLDELADDGDHAWLLGVNASVGGGERAPVLTFGFELADRDHEGEAAALLFATAPTALSTHGDDDDDDARSAGIDIERLIASARGAAALRVVANWDEVDARGPLVADYLQYTKHGYFALRDISELESTSSGELRGVMRGFRRDRAHVAIVEPIGDVIDDAALSVRPALGQHALVPWRAPVDVAEARRPLRAHPRSLAASVTSRQLDNGLIVELAPDPASPVVDIRLVFPGGSLDEPADQPGLAELAARLLGHDYSHPYQLRDYDRILFGFERGTQLGTVTDERTTTFIARGLAHDPTWHIWRLAWLIDKGVYARSRFDAYRTELRRVQARLADDDADEARSLRLTRGLFGDGHPYARPTPGTASLLKISRAALERWRRAHYRMRGARLIVSGGFDPTTVWPAVTELFGPFAGDLAAPASTIPAPASVEGPTWLAEPDDDRSQTHIVVGFTSGSDESTDRAARAVLAAIIEDRLRIIREGMGLSYGVSAQYRGGAGGSALMLSGDVAAEGTAVALERMLAISAQLRAGGEEFERDFVRARRRVLAAAESYSGGARAVAWTLTRLAATGRDLDDAVAFPEEVAAVTPAAVLAVAATDLDARRRVVQLTGPSAVIARAFAAVGATPR